MRRKKKDILYLENELRKKYAELTPEEVQKEVLVQLDLISRVELRIASGVGFIQLIIILSMIFSFLGWVFTH